MKHVSEAIQMQLLYLQQKVSENVKIKSVYQYFMELPNVIICKSQSTLSLVDWEDSLVYLKHESSCVTLWVVDDFESDKGKQWLEFSSNELVKPTVRIAFICAIGTHCFSNDFPLNPPLDILKQFSSAVVVNGKVFQSIGMKELLSVLKNEQEIISKRFKKSCSTFDVLTVLSLTQFYSHSRKTLFKVSQLKRKKIELKIDKSSFTVGSIDTAFFRWWVVLDPLSKIAQKWSAMLNVFSQMEGMFFKVNLSPSLSLKELPLERFYRYVLQKSIQWEKELLFFLILELRLLLMFYQRIFY
jgi:hypothetical protein